MAKKMSESLRAWLVQEYRETCLSMGIPAAETDLIDWMLNRRFSPAIAARLTRNLPTFPITNGV